MKAPLRAAALLVALAVARPATAESPKWGTFEVRVGQYLPDVDAEFDGAATPFADVYGTDRGWFPKILASYTLLDRFVQVDVGLGTGWFRLEGKGRQQAQSTDPVTGDPLFDPVTGDPIYEWVPSRDTTKFNVIPATLALTVRVDGAAERWPVPLSVYGRVALERYHWWVTDGSGSESESGATNGWSFGGGVAFLLDFVDPYLARELEADSGVNDTWLYFEVERSRVDDFGSSRSWNLSDEKLTLSGGLRMVF